MIDLHIANPTHLSKMLMRNITVLLFVVFLSVNDLIGLADNPEHHRVVSIAEIEESVIGAVTWNQWADNIVSLYPYNPTISDVYNLFTIW